MVTTCKHVCKDHTFQSKKYGPKKRVFTRTADGRLRCTVCGQEQSE